MPHDDASATPASLSRFAVLVRKTGRTDRAASVVANPMAFRERFESAARASRDRLGELEQDLAAAFLLAPEAAALDSMSSYEQLLELGRTALGRTVFDLSVEDVSTLLTDVFPNEVMLEVDDLAPLLGDLRLFFSFVGRVFDHEPARHAAAHLGDDALRALEVAVAQSTRFTKERAILAEGTGAGFDMHTREGVEAYIAWKKARVTDD